jgi:hypothetical protein
VVLSRRPGSAPWRVAAWDAATVGDWAAELEGAAAVVNLAGRSVDCRYNPENRREIRDSRVRSTRAVGEAVARAARPPCLWLQASTATLYAHRFDAPNDEATGILGGSERATRRVTMRTAMVMSPERGGVFDVLLGLVRRNGSRQGRPSLGERRSSAGAPFPF